MIKKILIANRGEIANRIIGTCRELDISTVSLYTEPEKSSLHVLASHEACSLGEGVLKETYLNQEKIIDIAKRTKADAIHPGYGFLSENTEFAENVRKNDLIFIGPTSEAIHLMGDKKRSKDWVHKINVPSIPGYNGEKQDPQTLLNESKKIGFPILLKASAGGGGKGMRIVNHETEFLENLEAAKRESKNSFGDDTILVEKYIQNPRHIEVQVMSDNFGNHFHFFERECSIQRRYQKIIEETPSVALTDSIRKAITETSVEICKHIKYLGAGTIEYILDEDGKFYFLEMNTRLQVEHPITELVTGYDLVKLQILAASNLKFNLEQKDIKQNGHAIEARIYAEDPDNSFFPTTGTLTFIGETNIKNIRVDIGYKPGDVISTNFDPMLAKVSAWGKDRNQAIHKLIHGLCDYPFMGLKTNREFLIRILKTKAFHQGETFTNFINKNKEFISKQSFSNQEIALGIASYYFSNKESKSNSGFSRQVDIWANKTNFRNGNL